QCRFQGTPGDIMDSSAGSPPLALKSRTHSMSTGRALLAGASWGWVGAAVGTGMGTARGGLCGPSRGSTLSASCPSGSTRRGDAGEPSGPGHEKQGLPLSAGPLSQEWGQLTSLPCFPLQTRLREAALLTQRAELRPSPAAGPVTCGNPGRPWGSSAPLSFKSRAAPRSSRSERAGAAACPGPGGARLPLPQGELATQVLAGTASMPSLQVQAVGVVKQRRLGALSEDCNFAAIEGPSEEVQGVGAGWDSPVSCRSRPALKRSPRQSGTEQALGQLWGELKSPSSSSWGSRPWKRVSRSSRP
uniref:Uncharacterized protein n=1 Tax=Chelydra serpentina TaxID=8475 RepID=A0A8C3SZG7_CHESE